MQQQQLVAGDTLNFLTSVPTYPATSGWLLFYRLVPRLASNTAIAISTTAEGADYRTQVTSVVTAAYAADSYTWFSWVEKGLEKYTVDDGQIVIKPNPRTAAAGLDGRSMAVRTLEDLKAAWAGWNATNGATQEYQIADRKKVFKTSSDIITQVAYWEREVQREVNAQLSANGQNRGGRMFIRHTR